MKQEQLGDNNRRMSVRHKMSNGNAESPQLFVQLDKLDEPNAEGDHLLWNEKARWIRFEEQAEDVLGRWSKPHVATLPQASLEELNKLVSEGRAVFDAAVSEMKEISDVTASILKDFLEHDASKERMFKHCMHLPHHHHHEKAMKKNHSDHAMVTDDIGSVGSLEDDCYKENKKFKKKVDVSAEGAAIMVMPVEFVSTCKLVFVRLAHATELTNLLEVKIKTKFVVLIIGPIERHIQLYEVGRVMSTCLADDVCREMFYTATSILDLASIVAQFTKSTMVIPPSNWNPKIRIEPPESYMSKEERKKVTEIAEYIHDDEPNFMPDNFEVNLVASKRPFFGLAKDLRRKWPHYLSDFRDCLTLECVATTIYMYLVSLCSLVAFGAMLGKKTDNLMATTECILASSVCGILFALFSGQPLNIISATGPMLILEALIKNLCDKFEVNFMEFRLWIGLWTCLFLFLFVMFNLSFLVKFITRFTEDCFATLVAVIFIIDALKSIGKLKELTLTIDLAKMDAHNDSNSLDIKLIGQTPFGYSRELQLRRAENESTFYFSAILFMLTFTICMGLKSLVHMPYLTAGIRKFLSDFAVCISIIVSSLLDYWVNLNTLKLSLPSSFAPTKAGRSWVIPIYSGRNSAQTIFVAILPAIIATILVFMDQQITAVIVNRKEFKLKKSCGYHLDLLVICVSIAVCSVLGLPWFVAATVLALSHVNSLKVFSHNTAPGEKPKFIGVREQRVTTLVISILIGLSVFLNSILGHIPMAVLYGVFLFMGVAALRGMQFFERVLILFMPIKYQPDRDYLRHVKTLRVHLFTVIQFISTCGLYLIKYIDTVAITFPILVAATCIIRKGLDYIFTQRELYWLDDILPNVDCSSSANGGGNVDKPLKIPFISYLHKSSNAATSNAATANGKQKMHLLRDPPNKRPASRKGNEPSRKSHENGQLSLLDPSNGKC